MEYWQFSIIMFVLAEISLMWALYQCRKGHKVQQKVKVKNWCELERILYTHGETAVTNDQVIINMNEINQFS